jgi:hypothetical protein
MLRRRIFSVAFAAGQYTISCIRQMASTAIQSTVSVYPTFGCVRGFDIQLSDFSR